MKTMRIALTAGLLVCGGVWSLSCRAPGPDPDDPSTWHVWTEAEQRGFPPEQFVPWTQDDLAFFLHGSMGTEVIPVSVLAAFRLTYPDLFPGDGLAAFGLLETPGELPVGVSRREVPHLGGLPSFGLNCASCHVAELRPVGGGRPVRVMGTTAHFDAEGFLGAVVVAQFRTMDADNMVQFLANVVRVRDPEFSSYDSVRPTLATYRTAIAAVVADDPFGVKGIAPGALHDIAPGELVVGHARSGGRVFLWSPPTEEEAARSARAYLRLFHNMRAALHVPDAIPTVAPPASGPGRNDAFGLLAASLFNAPADYAPVKYGIVWNVSKRPWVHWDGNSRSALGRNVLASLGLGAPLVDGRGQLDMKLVERQTALTEQIMPPAWPWDYDRPAAARGKFTYAAQCAHCHDGPESDARLHDVRSVGTDPRRATGFDEKHAALFNEFFGAVKIDGFTAPAQAPIRSTGRYWAPSLDGAWARSPYLHNGSVRTMEELLTPPSRRPKTFRRGSRDYDTATLGFTDAGSYVFDTTTPGNANTGHDFGADLDAAARRDLIEYLKSR